MSKAWAENMVDRYLTYCFDLNHNTEKDAPMTYDVHSIVEKIRKDIRPDVRWCDCCHTSRGEVLGVVR